MSGNLEQRVDDMASDMREMRNSMKIVAEAITKLAVLDEKSHFNAVAMDKVLTRMDKIEDKFNLSELDRVKFEAEAIGVAKSKAMMWGGVGTFVVAAIEMASFALRK